VINADGSGLEKVTRGTNVDCSPSWSPDGSKLAMLTFVPHRWLLATMAPDGSSREILIERGNHDDPDWSPDGSQIVFTRTPTGQRRTDVFVIDSDGSGLTRLTDTPGRWEWTPVFSPNGARIAFVRGQDARILARGDIYSMLPDGTDVVRITDTRRDEYSLSWQAT
jgi:TolB protein